MQNRQASFGDFMHNRSCKLVSLESLATAKPPRPASPDETQAEIHALFEQLRQKNAEILLVKKKLNHFRSWMNTLQSKVNVQNAQAVKNARRLYIGGFPQGSSEEELRLFLSGLMVKTGGCVQAGCSVTSVKLMKDKNYAFAEMRSVEEAANATAFDGVAYKDSYLKVKRPSNYDVNSAVLLGPVTPDPTIDISGLDICCSTVEDSPNKLFIGGLPYDNTEEQVRSILASFGALKSFNLVMDRNTGKSKGYAFCELVDGSLTDHVIQQLNSKKIGSKSLTVKRAVEGTKPASPLLSSMLSSSSTSQNLSPSSTPTYRMTAANPFGFGSMPHQPHALPLGMGNSPRGMNSSSVGRADINSPVLTHNINREVKSMGVNEFIPQPAISLPSLGVGMGLDGSMPLGTSQTPSSMAFVRQSMPVKINSYGHQHEVASQADFGQYYGVGGNGMEELHNLLANASIHRGAHAERVQGVNIDNCSADCASLPSSFSYGAFGRYDGNFNNLKQKTGAIHSTSIW